MIAVLPAFPAYQLSSNPTIPTLGRANSLVVDGEVIIAVAAPGSFAPALQSVTGFKRLDSSSAAIAYALDGPFVPGSSPPFPDAPQGLAGTAAVADQLWVANKGIPGGATDSSSNTNLYGMTTAARTGSPLAFAINNTIFAGGQSRGVAVNEAAHEVYVSDGANSVLVFDSTTGTQVTGANGTIATNLDVPQGLFWDKGALQRLYIAANSATGNGSVEVYTRGVTGAFSFTRSITDISQAKFLKPSAVWVTTPASGNQQLWIASAGVVKSTSPR